MKDGTDYIFSFPQRAPRGARTERDSTVLEDLELWKIYQDNWCEHKPSVTVHYTDDEWFGMLAWIWENFDDISGIAMLPRDDHAYTNAPYEAIDRETYERLSKEMPVIDWPMFKEDTDNTIGSQELACSGGVCEVNEL